MSIFKNTWEHFQRYVLPDSFLLEPQIIPGLVYYFFLFGKIFKVTRKFKMSRLWIIRVWLFLQNFLNNSPNKLADIYLNTFTKTGQLILHKDLAKNKNNNNNKKYTQWFIHRDTKFYRTKYWRRVLCKIWGYIELFIVLPLKDNCFHGA